MSEIEIESERKRDLELDVQSDMNKLFFEG